MMNDGELLLDSLRRFFSEEKLAVLKGVLDAVPGAVSLRTLSWFVGTYAKDKNLILVKKHPEGDVSYLHVHLSYRGQLQLYSKQQFDPFRRGARVAVEDGGVEISTTVGQLNFFRWVIESGVLEYVRANRNAVEEALAAAGGVAGKKPAHAASGGAAGDRFDLATCSASPGKRAFSVGVGPPAAIPSPSSSGGGCGGSGSGDDDDIFFLRKGGNRVVIAPHAREHPPAGADSDADAPCRKRGGVEPGGLDMAGPEGIASSRAPDPNAAGGRAAAGGGGGRGRGSGRRLRRTTTLTFD